MSSLQPVSSFSSLSISSSEDSPIKSSIPPFDVLINGVKTNDLEQVKSALKNGANPNEFLEEPKKKVIHIACEKGYLDVVRALFEGYAKLNVNARDFRADTPLHRACIFGYTEIVEELIKHGADVNLKNKMSQETPLEYAISSRSFECCKLLIDAGAKVNEINDLTNSTPLLMACKKGLYKIVELLLNSKADPNLSVADTPLYEAVGSPKIVQLLLEQGAKVNCENPLRRHFVTGETPLHRAAAIACDESVEILLKAGANLKAKNSYGKTPLDLATWKLDNLRNKPFDSPEITSQLIKNLEKIIKMLKEKEDEESSEL